MRALPKTKTTKGPWGWFGSTKSSYFYLACAFGNRRFVMTFDTKTGRRAEPYFQVSNPYGSGENGTMTRASELAKFEVGDRSVVGHNAATNDRSVYRYDVSSIDHPDARLIAAAPRLYAILRELIELGPDEPIGDDRTAQALSIVADVEGLDLGSVLSLAKPEGHDMTDDECDAIIAEIEAEKRWPLNLETYHAGYPDDASDGVL